MAAKKRAKKTAGAKPKAEKKTPKRMGRPPRAGAASTTGVTVRFTREEFAVLKHRAEQADTTVTEWIRDRALSAQ